MSEITLPQGFTSQNITPVPAQPERVLSLAELERGHIIMVLALCQNNKTAAAKTLGITIKTLYNKLHCYGLFEDYKKHA